MLHDPQLEKTTADVLAAHKSADVAAAMQKALDIQAALDRAEIAALETNEAANLERALSEMLSADPEFQGTKRLSQLVNNRIEWIAGKGAVLNLAIWKDRREKLIGIETTADPQERNLKLLVKRYEDGGGHDFKECESFATAHGDATPGSNAALVAFQCKIVEAARAPDVGFTTAVSQLESGTGDFADVSHQLDAARDAVKQQTDAENVEAAKLKMAKDVLAKVLAEKAPEEVVRARLVDMTNALAQLDKEAGLLPGDDPFQPGKALAAIRFRKTTLRDVLDPKGKDGEAAIYNQAAVGVIAGVIRYQDAGKSPSQAALAVALAHQTGLEAVASAQLESRKNEVRLLGEEREAYLRELEFLAMARSALDAIPATASCNGRPASGFALAELIRNPGCPRDLRQSAARALSAYNMAWASGRTPARVLDRELSQEIYRRKMSVTNQVVRARYQVELSAIQELAAAGAGGIRPEEIATFMQAIGLPAIAIGVNK